MASTVLRTAAGTYVIRRRVSVSDVLQARPADLNDPNLPSHVLPSDPAPEATLCVAPNASQVPDQPDVVTVERPAAEERSGRFLRAAMRLRRALDYAPGTWGGGNPRQRV